MSKLDKEALESLDSMRELMDNADCLISQQEVERALDRMAEAITRDLGDKLPVFYCVMNGGLITTGSCFGVCLLRCRWRGAMW